MSNLTAVVRNSISSYERRSASSRLLLGACWVVLAFMIALFMLGCSAQLACAADAQEVDGLTPEGSLAIQETSAYLETSANATAAGAPCIEGSFDKESYSVGEHARVMVKVVNTSETTWQSVNLTAKLPGNLKLTESNTPLSLHVESLIAGAVLELPLEVVFVDAPVGSSLASTGDDSISGNLIALAAFIAFSVLAVATFSCNKGRARRAGRGMSLLLSVVVAVGMVPFVARTAFADEPLKSSSAIGFEVKGNVACSSPAAVVSVVLTAESVSTDPGSTKMSSVATADGQPISADARYAIIDVVSDEMFAEDISAKTVTLGEGFEQVSLASVERTGSNTATVRLDGNPGAAGTDGLLVFGRGSFVDPTVLTGASISMEAPLVYFDVAEGSYDQAAATFTFPISVEAGRLSESASASCFTFADERIESTSLVVSEQDSRQATLSIAVDAATSVEQFTLLAQALDSTDAAVMTIAPELLVGEPKIGTAHEKIQGIPETTASAAQAFLFGTIDATEVSEAADGTLTIDARVDMEAEGGSLALSSLDQIIMPADLSNASISDEEAFDILNAQGILTQCAVRLLEHGTDWFTFSFDIAPERAIGWLDGYEDLIAHPEGVAEEVSVDAIEATTTASDEEAKQLFLDDITMLLAGQGFGFAEGVVLNDLGIPQSECLVSFSGASSASDLLGSTPSDGAKTAFEVLSALANAIGSFCQQDKASIGGGIGAILGLIADMVNTDPTITLKDVFDELQQMKGQLSRMETGIDSLAVELSKVSKRNGFDANWAQVKLRLDHLGSYEKLYGILMQKIDGSDKATSYDNLSSGNKKLLEAFAKKVEQQDKLMNTTVVDETMSMGSLILGFGGKDIVAEYNSWIETYYNWDSETFAAKSQYTEALATAYVYGYGTSMAYLKTMEANDDDDFFGPEDSVYHEAAEKLRKQADQVIKKLFGTVVTIDGIPQLESKSTYRLATEERKDGLIRCLINEGKLYDKGHFSNHTYSGAPQAFSRSVDRDSVYLYKQNRSTITSSQWAEMVKNLPQVKQVKGFEKATSVYEELRTVGFTLGEHPGGRSANGDFWNKNQSQTTWYNPYYYGDHLVAVGDANYNKILDQTAIEHNRTTTLDVFNLQTGQMNYGVQSSWHHEVYLVSPAWWGYKHDLYPIVVF